MSNVTENPIVAFANNRVAGLGLSRNVRSWGWDPQINRWVIVVEVACGPDSGVPARVETAPFLMRDESLEGSLNMARALAVLDFLNVKAEDIGRYGEEPQDSGGSVGGGKQQSVESAENLKQASPSSPKESVTVAQESESNLGKSSGKKRGRMSKKDVEEGKQESSSEITGAENTESSQESTTPSTSGSTGSTAKENPKAKSTNTPSLKHTSYDSSLQQHKVILASHLNKDPAYRKDWAKDVAASKKYSQEVLHGKPFLDEEGNIVESFKGLLVGQYGA